MTGAASGEARKLISALAGSGCRTVLVSTPAKKVMGWSPASILAGGPAPFLAAYLMTQSGGNPWSVAVYIIVLSLLTAFAVFMGPETNRSDISAEHPDDKTQRI
jgi:hypothetical protein